MNTRIKAKHQRLVLLIIALVAIIGAGLLAVWALQSQASFFYLPSEIVEEELEPGQAVRLGGMIEAGSMETAEDGITVQFVVNDGEVRLPVSFTGIVPALVVEGSGVVAEGSMGDSGTFIATNLLAKHDENYMPRELEGMSTAEVRAEHEATLE